MFDPKPGDLIFVADTELRYIHCKAVTLPNDASQRIRVFPASQRYIYDEGTPCIVLECFNAPWENRSYDDEWVKVISVLGISVVTTSAFKYKKLVERDKEV